MQSFEYELDCARHERRIAEALAGHPQRLDLGLERRHAFHELEVLRRGDVIAGIDDHATLERFEQVAVGPGVERGLEGGQDGRLQQMVDDLGLAALFEGLDLDLAHRGGHQRTEVADPGNGWCSPWRRLRRMAAATMVS